MIISISGGFIATHVAAKLLYVWTEIPHPHFRLQKRKIVLAIYVCILWKPRLVTAQKLLFFPMRVSLGNNDASSHRSDLHDIFVARLVPLD